MNRGWYEKGARRKPRAKGEVPDGYSGAVGRDDLFHWTQGAPAEERCVGPGVMQHVVLC